VGTPNNPISSGVVPPTAPGSPTASSNTVSFAFQNILPPSALYIGRDDQLVIQGASSAANEVVTVNLRLLAPNGRIEDNQFKVALPVARFVVVSSFALAEGFLLSMSMTSALATTRGQTFVRAFLNRGAYGAGLPGQTLVADYVTNNIGAGYPGGRILAPTEGPGAIRQVQAATPGAGVEWTIAVPLNTRWRLLSLAAQLITSAVAANRIPHIIMSMGGASTSFRGEPNQVVPASSTVIISGSAAPVITAITTITVNVGVPPDVRLASADGIASATLNIQAADQYSAIFVSVEEWLDNV
jgi:hypothetical protein